MKTINNLAIKSSDHIHFIGICGYLMSGVAITLKQQGFQITGSDENAYPPTTDLLKKEGVKVTSYSPDNLIKRPALVVIGNHVNADNVEVQAAQKQNLKITSLPALIYQLFSDKKRIVVAGTHGKTTTASLIAWILKSCDLDPSYLIGGLIRNTHQGYRSGQGEYVVIEGDEYKTAFFDTQPKIFHYHPDIAVLTTCEFDHPDYFQNLDQVKETFIRFLNQVSENGIAILNVDDANIASFQKQIKPKIATCGFSDQADYRIQKVLYQPDHTEFEINYDGKILATFSLKLPGQINVQNAAGAIAVAHQLNIPQEKIKKALSSFFGVSRRFEVIFENQDLAIIDDYAHHPTKISETIKAARLRYPQSHLWVIFEPHTYSRTRALFPDYVQSLKNADQIILSPLLPARERNKTPTIKSQDIVKELASINKKAFYFAQKKDLIQYLVNHWQRKSVILIMSVSGLDNLAQDLKVALK